MSANPKSAASTNNVPSREQFVREYMEQLGQSATEGFLVDRIVGWRAEDRAVAAVKNSKRTFGRLSAAWEIADAIKEEAYATEHAKHAEAMAARLGLK